MEIKITSCSSFDILKPISIFLSQNPSIGKIKEDPSLRNIPTKKIQTGGEKEKEKEKQNITGTPIYHFSKFMDTLLSRKQTENHKNKEVYNSLFPTTTTTTTTTPPKTNINTIPPKSIDSIKTNNMDKRENSLDREKIANPSTITIKKIYPIINPPIVKSIYIDIHTDKPDKLKAIKGTKLYYLAQRNGKCTNFV
jgi:hypothetical protein